MTQHTAQQLLTLVRDGRVAEFLALATELDPADLADVLAEANDDERLEIVKLLPPSLSGSALWELPEEEHAEATLAALEPAQAADIVEELPDDDAADLLGELEPEEQQRILAQVEDPEQREEVQDLLQYDPESAGGLMTAQFVSVAERATVAQALDEIRRQADEIEDFSEAYVVDDGGRLRGLMGFKRLVLSAPDRPVREVMDEPDVTVPPEMDQEEVARLMARYNVSAIPVVDQGQRLLGRITFDDVMDVGEAEATEDLLKFGGVSGDEDLGGSWQAAVKSRLRWLFVNLITAAGGAAVVGLFQENIDRILALAIWMPIVGGLGGNTGTQALAVTIRRLSLGLVSPDELRPVVGKEMLVGLTNGVAVGLVAGLVATLVTFATGGPPLLGLVVFLAMVTNLLVAGTLGAFVPLILQRFGVDPAVASSVFVTAFTDMCGFALLLGLAGWILL
ncbi:MAG: magnesium transporter [Gemmatimonadales bacterium]|nr:magnesium transporter [Gemmatimonadales bacterium]